MFITVGVFSVEGPPVPIPNTEVKLYSGDNTCLETDREDSSMPTPLVGDSNAEGPPVPIPNTEVKLCSGNNTCLETDREDSSLPTQADPLVRQGVMVFSVTPLKISLERVCFIVFRISKELRRNIHFTYIPP